MKKGAAVLILVLSVLGCSQKGDAQSQGGAVPVELDDSSFRDQVWDYTASNEWSYKGTKPAIIDFYADWCGPCRTLAPILEDIASEYGDDIIVYKVNVDEQQGLARLFSVQSIPMLYFVPLKGQPQYNVGLLGRSDLVRVIEDLLIESE